MADWGAFTKGLAATTAQLPHIMQMQQGLAQRGEALARQEKQLNEQIKRQDTQVAEKNFYEGLKTLQGMDDPDIAKAFIKGSLRPTVEKLSTLGVFNYAPEEINDFVSKLEEYPKAANGFSKSFLKTIEQYTTVDKTTGKQIRDNKAILQNLEILVSGYIGKIKKGDYDMAAKGPARSLVTDPNASPEDKKYASSFLDKDEQGALGLTEEKKPYKVGQILPNQIIGDTTVSLQVTGFDEEGMPTFRQVAGGPRYKPPAEGGVIPAEKKAAKEAEEAYKTAATGVSSYIAKTKEDRAKWYAALGKTKKGSEDEKKITAELENFDTQLSTAQATLDGLRNKEIDPKTVKFGKGSQESQGQFRGKVSTTITSELKGMKAGRYRVAGQEVQWDGTKVIQ
jgi:hypothetical protein